MNAANPQANILVVDDTLANLRLLSDMLKHQGYKVRGVTTGAMALTAIEAAAPDIVLLDVKMPETNGYEVAQQLKNDARFRDIPIIFISAMDDVADKVKAFEAGGVDYITKPIEQEEVLARVATHLQLRRLQLRLEKRTEQLERGIQELDAFARTVAHDLKSPLNTIIGYAELASGELAESATPCTEALEWLQTIAKTGHKMNEIIEALLLLAGVSQRRKVTVQPLDMAVVVAQARQRLDFMIKESGGIVRLPEHWPPALGYAPWIEEVWANYLSNGLKYGGDPPVLELGADEPEAGWVRFWVRDTGPGLSAADQAKLFTPFTRLHQEHGGGHGLGLSIVQCIIERLGGAVGVESTEGAGSLFYFTLRAV